MVRDRTIALSSFYSSHYLMIVEGLKNEFCYYYRAVDLSVFLPDPFQPVHFKIGERLLYISRSALFLVFNQVKGSSERRGFSLNSLNS